MITGPVTLSTLGFGPPPKRKVGRRLKPKEFRHWVCYHDPVERGYPVGREMFLDCETKKTLNRKRLTGDTVHLITWAARGSKYQLVGYYEVVGTQLLPVNRRRPKAILVLSGTVGYQYTPRVQLNNLPWFRQYYKKNGLSHGFQSIRNPLVLKGLIGCTKVKKTRVISNI